MTAETGSEQGAEGQEFSGAKIEGLVDETETRPESTRRLEVGKLAHYASETGSKLVRVKELNGESATIEDEFDAPNTLIITHISNLEPLAPKQA